MSKARSTILIIDDDSIVRESVAAYLSQCLYTVMEAESGKQGLALFRSEHPQLILCDLRMPNMDGLAVLREIRSEAPNLPFIVMTGAGVLDDVVEALRLGASDFLTKPIVDLEVLEYAINRALDSAKLVEENQRYRENLESAIYSLESNLNLLREDQKAGRQVQMKMLPHSPLDFEGYHLNHHIIPSLYLSGDFVDYFKLDDHRLIFYLADVSGHGASSAFITVLLKHMSMNLLQDYLSKPRRPTIHPSQVLDYINQSLLQSNLGKHVTLFGGVIDTRRSTLTYSFGGHFPFPVLTTNNSAHFIEGGGFPLGLFEEATFEDTTINLPSAFNLTIFSDGILEILPQDNLNDKEAYLLSVLQKGSHSIHTLKEALALNAIHEAPDDIAILMLNRS
ncbi:SpoIIE family protein phosphatase [Candidatus Sororendozoicomonas aggregata]|uniref:SpoIIE family protein phosphatase n=1 Tax=Candidatus Sororendozoicomonas aggregata TaxID=3073239 RepID=UPI002ED469F9